MSDNPCRGPEFLFQNVVGFFKRFPRVSLEHFDPVGDVAVSDGLEMRNVRITLQVLMDQRGVGLQGLPGIEDGGQLLIVRFDQLDGFRRRVLIGRRHRRDGLAHITNLLLGQNGIVENNGAEAEEIAVPVFRAILRREDRFDAPDFQGLGYVYIEDQGVRQPAAEVFPVQHVRQVHVGDEGARAGRLLGPVFTRQVPADPSMSFHCFRFHLTLHV